MKNNLGTGCFFIAEFLAYISFFVLNPQYVR